MRVLFTANIPSPYRVDFFNELGKLCELTVLYEARTAKSRNDAWIAEEALNFKPIFLKGIRIGEAEGFCPEIVKYLSTEKYDVIIIGLYSSPTGMLAIQHMITKRIPFILSSDGGLIKGEKKVKCAIKKHFIGAAKAWLSTGKLTTDYLEHYGADRKKTYVYPFTSLKEKDLIEAEAFTDIDKLSIRNSLCMREDKIILTVGRFTYQGGYGKGYDTLLRMAKRLPKHIGIYIVGDEPTEEFVNWKKKEKLDNVHFVGFKEKEELKKYYVTADLFVLMTIYDVWGLVINEAMTFGLPVISSNKCVASTELIEDGVNGYVVPVGDDNILYEKCMDIICLSERQREFGVKSIQKIKNYTIENMAKEHIKVLKKWGEG